MLNYTNSIHSEMYTRVRIWFLNAMFIQIISAREGNIYDTTGKKCVSDVDLNYGTLPLKAIVNAAHVRINYFQKMLVTHT